ncbi:MAG TPA: hypothetical protein DCP92_12920 [Nitrospiraceae bacterium]|jgi:hypothetical protein|nr:hypothetical protein [Nitrospiraceae bacterium]
MKGKRGMVQMGTKVGAVVGVIGFLAFGIIPGFYFGSYGTLVLMSHLFGGPLQATALLRIVTAAGIILGITCVGFMSIVVGSVLGTVGGYVAVAVTKTLGEETPAEETAQVKAK